MTTMRGSLSPTLEDDALGAMIEPEPGRGRDRARLREFGVPVWAMIAELQANGWDVVEVARAYRVPEVAVRAAIHFYEGNKPFIDAFLLLNSDANDF